MGWTDSHLHAFTIGEKRYGMHFDEFPEGELDEKKFTLLQAIGSHAASATNTTSVTTGNTTWRWRTSSTVPLRSPSRCAWRPAFVPS